MKSSKEPETNQPETNQPFLATNAEDRFLNTQETMKFLNLSRGKVWELVKTGGLPAFKVGGDYRYRYSELVAWMEQFRISGEVPSCGHLSERKQDKE